MRAQAGHSRFVLLPSRPEAEEQDIDNEVLDAESLEIRIMAAEVLLMGPEQHASTSDAHMAAKPVTPLRAAKVCFRRSPCVSPTPAGCLVVAPHPEFQATCRALDAWSATLPDSPRAGLPLGRDDGAPWQTSYLPLPPRDSGLE